MNLSILFTELPLLERPAAAAAAGFTAVELWWPWIETPTPEQAELDALKKALDDAGTQLVGLNFYAGALPGPGPRRPVGSRRGVGPLPRQHRGGGRLRRLGRLQGAQRALRQPRRGRRPGRCRTPSPWRTSCSRPARPHRVGAILLVETLNKPESPLYPLVSAPSAIEVIDKVNAATGLGNAKFLLDLYHLSMNGENVSEVIEAYADKTGHVQIADNPGRGAPGTGSLPLEDLLDQLTKAGYDGLGRPGVQGPPTPPPPSSGSPPRPARLR